VKTVTAFHYHRYTPILIQALQGANILFSSCMHLAIFLYCRIVFLGCQTEYVLLSFDDASKHAYWYISLFLSRDSFCDKPRTAVYDDPAQESTRTRTVLAVTIIDQLVGSPCHSSAAAAAALCFHSPICVFPHLLQNIREDRQTKRIHV